MGESSFWYRPTRVVPDQRPLNGRCCCCWSLSTLYVLQMCCYWVGPFCHFKQGSHRSRTPPPVLTPVEFKYSSFLCRYIRRDIMCKRDVINIQPAHYGLVSPDCGTRDASRWMSIGPQRVFLHAMNSPKLHVGCASISWAATFSCLGLSIKLEVHNCQGWVVFNPWVQ